MGWPQAYPKLMSVTPVRAPTTTLILPIAPSLVVAAVGVASGEGLGPMAGNPMFGPEKVTHERSGEVVAAVVEVQVEQG